MTDNKPLIRSKLLEWESYLQEFHLPAWKDIPDIGLYMDQVMELLSHYLQFIPENAGRDKPLTSAAINNYVRLRVMPAPIKRKYYRTHIAYLIIIYTLKQSVSISSVQKMIPSNLDAAELEAFYLSYAQTLCDAGAFFAQQTRQVAKDILDPDQAEDGRAIQHLILHTILLAGFSGVLAEKLLTLDSEAPQTNQEDHYAL